MTTDVERRLPPIFPSNRTLFSGRQLSSEDLTTIDSMLGSQEPLVGYLVAEGDRNALYLLFLKGKPYCAGLFEGGSLSSLGVGEFFRRLTDDQSERTFDLFATDTAVLLLIAAHFQKRPVLSVSTDLASPEGILAKVEESGNDSIIALVDGALRHVAYCKEGLPVRFYTAGEVRPPDEEDLVEAITVFCFERGGRRPVVIEVYDDLAVAPAPDHGQPLPSYLVQPRGPIPRYELTVFDGNRHIDTRVFQTERCIIGRIEGAEMRVIDSAVSRQHAAIEWRGSDLVLVDKSENGTFVNNSRTRIKEQHVLNQGDEIRVGRTRLVFRLLPEAGEAPIGATMQIDPSTVGARVMHRGQPIPITREGIILGKGQGAEIQVAGFWVRPRQARIYRNPEGQYCVEHLGGPRGLSVNGRSTRSAVLKTGDAIHLGGETIRFYDAN